MAAAKVALVIGSTRGLGLATVKLLQQRAVDVVVYLTGKYFWEAKTASQRLKKEGFRSRYHQLDVTDEDSVRRCANHVQKAYKGIDYLVNNVNLIDLKPVYPNYWRAKRTIDVNYRAVFTIERYLFPLLRHKARVVNISSACGHLSNIKNEKWIKLLRRPDLTVAHIDYFVDQYLLSVHNGTFRTVDFADKGKNADLRVSQIARTALTMIQAKKYARHPFYVNALNPGNLQTNFVRGETQSPEEAAKLVVYLLLYANPSVTGAFIWDNAREVDWKNHYADLYYKHEDTTRLSYT